MTSTTTLRRSLIGPLSLIFALIALLVTPVHSWSHPSYRGHLTQTAHGAAASPLFVQKQHQSLSIHRRRGASELFSSEKEESEDLEESTSASEPTKKQVTAEDDDEEKFGVVKTVLLAGPLFIKFTIVLLIKFVTDLIVFPLLWLYRLARLTKRKFLKMIGKGEREYPNGEARP